MWDVGAVMGWVGGGEVGEVRWRLALRPRRFLGTARVPRERGAAAQFGYLAAMAGHGACIKMMRNGVESSDTHKHMHTKDTLCVHACARVHTVWGVLASCTGLNVCCCARSETHMRGAFDTRVRVQEGGGHAATWQAARGRAGVERAAPCPVTAAITENCSTVSWLQEKLMGSTYAPRLPRRTTNRAGARFLVWPPGGDQHLYSTSVAVCSCRVAADHLRHVRHVLVHTYIWTRPHSGGASPDVLMLHSVLVYSTATREAINGAAHDSQETPHHSRPLVCFVPATTLSH